ncbi:hypothetical protein SAMN05421823_1153 [Catalinimonas alkaloidigena]|uniref:Uncharacterized protein n=1 Tax=Catalinimonas alkaloidigena TaxID=1075417 RepID=A0A1G9TVH7_9BACT|nr:hypothetical protein SAMN05421823_1153 [Catalinimonas alkaloidigena]
MTFSDPHPYLAWWCVNHDDIQLGLDEDSPVDYFTMTLDAGGMCWQRGYQLC